MDKLSLDLKNCYGICTLKADLNFSKEQSDRKVAIIYAPNGTMKSSLANTLQSFKDGNLSENANIFKEKPTCDITVDGISCKDGRLNVLVLNPLVQENIRIDSVLVSDENLRREYDAINNDTQALKDAFYAKIKEKIHVNRNFDVESTILADMNCPTEDSLLECLRKIQSSISDSNNILTIPEEYLKYNELLSSKVIGFFCQPEQASLVETYEKQYKAILEKSNFLGKSGFDHMNLIHINEALKENRFFGTNGKIVLAGKDSSTKEFATEDEINKFIEEEKERILTSSELKETYNRLAKALEKNSDMKAINNTFKEFPILVKEYSDIARLKEKLWVTVFSYCKQDLENLISTMEAAHDNIARIISIAKSEERDWQQVLLEFKRRFHVPFDVSIANQHSVIINSDAPVLKFTYSRMKKTVSTNEDELTKTLSYGELRALKILNMLFKLTALRKSGDPYLVVLDDIADSFDYKNKYAIIEYIRDLADIKVSQNQTLFSLLILTHNFDFYRTVAKRLGIGYSQIYMATKDDENNVTIFPGGYLNDVFNFFANKINKEGQNEKIIIAAIPFVRNLIEYRFGDQASDYSTLTSYLHVAKDTAAHKMSELEVMFKKHWRSTITFPQSIINCNYLSFVYKTADNIRINDTISLEQKITLSIAIRLKAEEFLQKNVQPTQQITSNQTAELVKCYKDQCESSEKYTDNMKVLSDVLLMTPENIHMNSFMYEPIIDMSLHHLVSLYENVKKLRA